MANKKSDVLSRGLYSYFHFMFYSWRMDELIRRLRGKATALGFTHLGVVPARPGRRLGTYLRWIAAGMNGRMGYMARPDRVERRQDLNVVLPGVQSIICVGLDYQTLKLPEVIANDPGRGQIGRAHV